MRCGFPGSMCRSEINKVVMGREFGVNANAAVDYTTTRARPVVGHPSKKPSNSASFAALRPPVPAPWGHTNGIHMLTLDALQKALSHALDPALAVFQQRGKQPFFSGAWRHSLRRCRRRDRATPHTAVPYTRRPPLHADREPPLRWSFFNPLRGLQLQPSFRSSPCERMAISGTR